jgi:hypothetical protein
MPSRDSYVLRIARLDDRRLNVDPGPITVYMDVDDAEDREEICGEHFIPLAWAAEGLRGGPRDYVSQMPFLSEYKLEIYHPNRSEPVAQSRSTHGWRD